MTPAGFWRRLAAYWIDALPIFLATALVFYFFLGFKTLSALPFFLGFMWIGWSKTKQGWHDRISRCFVVRAPNRSSQ